MQAHRIQENIESTLENLGGTVDQVKAQAGQGFGLRGQFEQRPLLMFGAAVAAGYLLGSAGGSDDDRPSLRGAQPLNGDSASRDYARPIATPITATTAPASPPPPSDTPVMPVSVSPPASSEPQSKISLPKPIANELDSLQGTAVTAIRNYLRDMIRDNVPAMREQVDELDRRSGRTPPRERGLSDPTQGRDYVKTYRPS